MRIPILHQDPDLLVVDKPAGIPTHAADPADPYPADAQRIAQVQTGLPYLGMHQRLDADTSGVLLFAARREANRALAAAFEGRQVRKVYLALVHGAPPRAEGVVDAPIVRDRGERYRVTAANDPRGLPARTRYRVIGRGGAGPRPVAHDSRPGRPQGDAPTLLEIIPETGRPHQIRVHLAHIGCPVIGDALYGPADQPAPRLCLHAYQLTVPHPATGEPMTFTAPPPLPFPPIPPGSSFDTLRADAHATRSATANEAVMLSGSTSQSPLRRDSSEASPSRVRDSSLVARRGALFAVNPLRVTAAASFGVGAGGEVALRELLRLAVSRRAPLAADSATTIYRVINAAADGLPGLTADRYGDALVVSLYEDAPAPDLREPALRSPRPKGVGSLSKGLEDLEGLLAETTGVRAIYIKHRPKEVSRLTDEQLAALAPPRPVYGPDLGEFVAHEDGLAYVIRPGAGLSVGLFPDMREGRGRVRAWARDRRVLNCFAYTCGFGVAAMAGGSQRVLNLDLSKSALEWGQANYRANGFEPNAHDFVYGDVFDWLARLAKRGDRFDLVILDPPGFSRTKSRRFSAAQDYDELAALAARCTAADGLLLACCNVAELPWRSFRDRVLAGLASAGRTAEVAGVYHEPAVDFPAALGSEPYLKMALVRLGK
ncbi:MAG: class I SAM-dependent methyltransferase [Chloroflexi bacterium]|nr:class I SAM-dependent methyltransferase [Chloroflexota bacterium]